MAVGDKPWSPTYVKEHDHVYERAIGSMLERLGFTVEMAQNELSRWDLRVMATRWEYVEVKHRPDIDWEGKYLRGVRVERIPIGGPLIDVEKAEALLEVGQGRFCYFCIPDDDIARRLWVTPDLLATCEVDTKDTRVINRPRGDLKDQGVAKYVLPFDAFDIFGKVVLA